MCESGKLNWIIPFKDAPDSGNQTEQVLGMKDMAVPIFAGILSALRRVIARRISLKVLGYLNILLPAFLSLFVKATGWPLATPDCSLPMLSEPTQKAASCNNNCFCYMFSISCGHVGHDYSEFLVGRHFGHDFFLWTKYDFHCGHCLLLIGFIGTLKGTSSESSRELPFSTWAYLSTILFGIILIFYVDSIAEERYFI